MQNQGNLIGLREVGRDLARSLGERNRQDRNVGRRSGAAGVLDLPIRENQKFGFRILEIEGELVKPIRWIQRRGGTGYRGGEEGYQDWNPVGQSDSDSIAVTNARRGKSVSYFPDLAAQGGISQAHPGFGRNEGDGLARRKLKQFPKGCGNGHSHLDGNMIATGPLFTDWQPSLADQTSPCREAR
jgi:hypothetical protein